MAPLARTEHRSRREADQAQRSKVVAPHGIARDRGSVSVELVVLFPALLALIFITAQAGLYYYARSVALAAAQEGARAGAVQNAPNGSASQAASDFIQQTGANLLASAQVQTQVSTTRAVVTVRGISPSLVPGYAGFPISQTAAAPVERVS